MEQKTKIGAINGRQDLLITREFNLPVELLFKAYADPSLLAQWMGTKVLKLENKKHGSYQFETTGAGGTVVFRANGAIHEFIPEKKIIRTFEIETAAFGVQLEVYDFEELSRDTSRLRMHVIYESAAQRDQVLKLPFAYGINMAHNRLQDIIEKAKDDDEAE